MVNDRCVVGCCDNDKRYPDRMIIHSNVTSGKLVFHKIPVNEERRKAWIHAVSKGREAFDPPKNFKVCSNHFIDGKPTHSNPNPTLFLTISTNTLPTPNKKRPPPKPRLLNVKPPKEKKRLNYVASEQIVASSTVPENKTANFDDFNSPNSSVMVAGLSSPEFDSEFEKMNDVNLLNDTDITISTSTDADANKDTYLVPMDIFQVVARGCVPFYTGFEGADVFEALFEYVKQKAAVMSYWDGSKKSSHPKKTSTVQYTEHLLASPGIEISQDLMPLLKSGPARKLTLEQEFMLVLIRLRLGLLVEDLAFRFCVSAGKVSQIVITGVILLSKELKSLIIWPSRARISSTLPDCFKRLYPNVRTIIDCSEIFFDTPSSLDVQACLWSDYKHHCTVKFLIAITPNGAVSWLSPLYGGRASDIHIVRDSGFLGILEPFDQVMADRGFKIKTDLTMKQCSLAIPPSAAKGTQMLSNDVKETSNIANVRIYVEQAIGRLKDFRILKLQQPLLHLPIMNNILYVCAALTNLKRPLAS